MIKECVICGTSFNCKGRDKVCSDDCRRKRDTLYHRQWVSEHLEENRAYMREYMRTGVMRF
jgi:hypothetical protein